uniref:Non-structural polyprotein 1AB n=1 Tax=Wenling crossorhombus astrovirus 1 TaxID=2116117 RepID=A0A2P1GMG7_9VIRU|nr:ORF1ab [Wenling crossorhombus astrovirus 1]
MDPDNHNPSKKTEDIYTVAGDVLFITEEEVSVPRVRYNRIGLRRQCGELVLPNKISVKGQKGWSVSRGCPVDITKVEEHILKLRICEENHCDEVRAELQRAKIELSQLRLENQLLRQGQSFKQEKEPSTSSSTMGTLKWFLCIIAFFWLAGKLKGVSADDDYCYWNGESRPAFCDGFICTNFPSLCEEACTVSETWGWTIPTPDNVISLALDAFQNMTEALGLTVFTPFREMLAGYTMEIISPKTMGVLVLYLMSGAGFYVMQLVVQIIYCAKAIESRTNIRREAALLGVAVFGGYCFMVRSVMATTLSQYSLIPVLLAATKNPGLLATGVFMQIGICSFILLSASYQTRIIIDKHGNEVKENVPFKAWLVHVITDTVTVLGTMLILQVPFTVIVALLFTYALWYGMQTVETKDYTITGDDCVIRSTGRKVRRMLVPFVSLQSKKTVGAVVTEKVYESAYPIRSADGNFGQAFLYNGRLNVLKHVTAGGSFFIKIAGNWQRVAAKLLKEAELGHGQKLLMYAVPPQLSGTKNCKYTEVRENGWMMVGYVNPEDDRREVQCFYGHWKDPQFVGVYEHMPGQSGAPVFDANGRLCAVHYAANGLNGLSLSIPIVENEPKARNPNAGPIANLQRAYNDAEDPNEKAKYKRMLGNASRNAPLREDYDEYRAFGEWTFLEGVEQRRTGYLNDHDDGVDKKWVTTQLLSLRNDLISMLMPDDDDTEQRKSLKKSKGATKAARRLVNRGGVITRSDMRKLTKSGFRPGKAFTEAEYNDLLDQGFSVDHIRTMAMERIAGYLEEDEYSSSDESMTYEPKDQGLFGCDNDRFSRLEANFTTLSHLVDQMQKQINEQKRNVTMAVRRLKKKVADGQTVDHDLEQMLRVDITNWQFSDDVEPNRISHLIDTDVQSLLKKDVLKVDPFSSVQITADGVAAALHGMTANIKCTGCKHCTGDVKEQASRKPLVTTKCGERTTCYTGHLKYCKKGCTFEDAVTPATPCTKDCWHFWCHVELAKQGKPCTNSKCRNPWSIENRATTSQEQGNLNGPGELGLDLDWQTRLTKTEMTDLGYGMFSSHIYDGVIGKPICDKHPRSLIETSVWGPIDDDLANNEFVPSTWDSRAYSKIFEKFSAKKVTKVLDDDVKNVALIKLLQEMEPMRNKTRRPVEMTTANAKSNPGYPWRECYQTEEDVRNDYGFKPVYDLQKSRERPLWYSFLKKEMLKKSKIDNNDIRMILCPPWTFKRIQASFDENQNEAMKEHTFSQECQVGWCPVKRGLDIRLRGMASTRDIFVTVDYTRYDGTIPLDVFAMVRQLRSEMLDISDEERDLLEWVNWQLLDKVVLLANGRVVKISKGNPSGQVSTSVDNCLVNTYITAASNAQWYKVQHGHAPDLETLNLWHDQLVYGDDRVGAYDTTICSAPEAEFVIDFFADYFGMWVKSENVKVQRNLQGLEFCGMKFHHDRNSDTWVGIYRQDKIKAAIRNPVKPAPDVEILKAKLASAKILCAYDPHMQEWISDKVRQIDDVCSTEFQVPTIYEAKKLWTDQKELKELSKAFK